MPPPRLSRRTNRPHRHAAGRSHFTVNARSPGCAVPSRMRTRSERVLLIYWHPLVPGTHINRRISRTSRCLRFRYRAPPKLF
jgi:hypothetical protein